MTKRRAWGHLVSRALGLGLLIGGLALVVGVTPAGADLPPGPLGTLQPGQWIAFTVSPSSPAFGDPVTLNAQSGFVAPATSAPTTSDLFTSGSWPTDWSAGGVNLSHSGLPCPASSGSCSFSISGSSGRVFFSVGPVPDSVVQSGNPTAWTVTVPSAPPPPTTTTPTTPPPPPPPPPNPNFQTPSISGPVTSPNGFSFTAPAQTGQGPYTYVWTLMSNGAQVDQQSGPTYTPPSSIFQSPTATYTLSLTVTDGLKQSASNNVSFEVDTSVGAKPPPQSPPPSPSSPPAQGPVATPGASTPVLSRPTLNAVSYAPQLARFATPTPGAVQPVTVIWLWRPNWFQTAQTAKTAGQPKAVKRADVSVDPAHAGNGQNATPELAALAAFGIFGFGWILFKRRRVRSALLD